jgi:PBSX family phage portal protein
MPSDEIEVKNLSDHSRPKLIEKVSADPFSQPTTVLKALGGLSAAMKKKMGRSKANEDVSITGYNAFQVKQPPYNLDYLAKLYELNSYNYSAINAKTIAVVGQGYDFVASPLLKENMEAIKSKSALEKARKRFMKEKRLMHEWLDTINPSEEFDEILTKVYLDYESTGNGYFEIGRDINGEIGYIGHIHSTTMRIRAKRDGFIQIVGNQAVFFRNYGDQSTTNPLGGDSKPNEVIHFKNYSPTSTFYGIPNIVAAMNAVAGQEFAARYNLDYFENKAVPRYIITIKGGHLSETAERKLLEFLEGMKGMAGNHRSVYIPIPEDTESSKSEFKMHEVENGIQDSSFNNYRKSTRDEILAVNGTPITKVSVAEGVSLAIARDADKTFSEQVVKPQQSLLAKKINRIIKELTDALLIQFNEISLTDADTQSKIWERLIRVQAMVPNEVRAPLGLPSLEGGDEIVDFTSGKGGAAGEPGTVASGNRQRDQARAGAAADSGGGSRQPKGDGRAQA